MEADVGCSEGGPRLLLHIGDRDYGAVEQRLQYAVAIACGTTQVLCDRRAMLFTQLKNVACSTCSLSSYSDHAAQEECEPSFPIAAVTHRLQVFVISLAVLLEIVGEVQHRLVQHATFRQQESDEKTPYAAVTIEEGVNGLELHVGKRDLDQGW